MAGPGRVDSVLDAETVQGTMVLIFIPANQHRGHFRLQKKLQIKVGQLIFYYSISGQSRVLTCNHKTTPFFASFSFLSVAINALFFLEC